MSSPGKIGKLYQFDGYYLTLFKVHSFEDELQIYNGVIQNTAVTIGDGNILLYLGCKACKLPYAGPRASSKNLKRYYDYFLFNGDILVHLLRTKNRSIVWQHFSKVE